MIKPVINNVISNIVKNVLVSSSGGGVIPPYDPTTNADLIQWLFTSEGFGVLDGQPVVKDAVSGEFREPQPNRCAEFDGISSRINFGQIDAFNFTSYSFSIFFLFRGDPNTNSSRIIELSSYQINGWEIYLAPGGFIFRCHTAGVIDGIQIVADVFDDQWHKVLLIFRSTAVNLYIDGVLTDTVTHTLAVPASTTNNIYLGGKTKHPEMKLSNFCVWDRELTISEIENPLNTADDSLCLWRMDDGSGTNNDNTIIRDSSGQGISGQVEGATLSSFHAEDPLLPVNAQNKLGYSIDTNGVYIPADVANPGYDVLNDLLEFSGPCSNPAKLVGSACLAVTLGTEYLQFASIPTGAVIASYQYTGTDPNPQIDTVNNQITFTSNSQIFNVIINDSGGSLWAHLSCAEKAGEIVYDHSGNGNNGSLVNFTLSSAWVELQDDYHDHIMRGYSRYLHATEPMMYVSYGLDGNPLSIIPQTGYALDGHNAAGNFHNGARTKIQQYQSAKMVQADQTSTTDPDYWFDSDGIANKISYAGIVPNVDDFVLANVSANQKRDVMTYDVAQVSPELGLIENYVATTSPDPWIIPTDIAYQDWQALFRLYQDTNGGNWTNDTGWLTAELAADYYGVTVFDSAVIWLSLPSNQLRGFIPTELGQLTNLLWLLLHSNQFSGPIPTELGQLTNLSGLSLYSNQLSGSIPTELDQLTNLAWLYFHSNQFTGAEMSNFVIDVLWVNRVTLGANSFTADITTSESLSLDAIDAIDGTGLYLNDGLTQAGCTVTATKS